MFMITTQQNQHRGKGAWSKVWKKADTSFPGTSPGVSPRPNNRLWQHMYHDVYQGKPSEPRSPAFLSGVAPRHHLSNNYQIPPWATLSILGVQEPSETRQEWILPAGLLLTLSCIGPQTDSCSLSSNHANNGLWGKLKNKCQTKLREAGYVNLVRDGTIANATLVNLF